MDDRERERAAMAMESAAAKWFRRPEPWSTLTAKPEAEIACETEEAEVEFEATQAKAKAKIYAQRRKAKGAAPQAGAAADCCSLLRLPTACEADVLEIIAAVRRSNVAAAETIHGCAIRHHVLRSAIALCTARTVLP